MQASRSPDSPNCSNISRKAFRWRSRNATNVFAANCSCTARRQASAALGSTGPPRSRNSRSKTDGRRCGPPSRRAPNPSKVSPRKPRRFGRATTTREPPDPVPTDSRETRPANKMYRVSEGTPRWTPDGQRSRPGSGYSGWGIGGGPDWEHAEVHEREPAADQRQAPQLRDVEHLRDRGDVEEVVRPGRDRQERALRARVLPRGGRGLELVVHAARRVRRPGRRRGHDRIQGAAGGDPTRAPQERRGD